MRWLRECVKWWQLLCCILASVISVVSILIWHHYEVREEIDTKITISVKKEVGDAIDRIEKSAKTIESAVRSLSVIQTQNITLPPSESELKDQRIREIHESKIGSKTGDE